MHTYDFKIKTNKTLVEKLENQLNITRLVYNLAKETKEIAYSKGVKLSKFDLIKQLPELKKEFIWISTVHAQTLQSVIERLDRGYDKFFSDLKKGIKTSKPKWAKKKNWSSIEFKQTAVKYVENEITISKIGKIKIFKSRDVQGNIKLARVVKRVDGWYLQIVTDYTRPKSDKQAEVGIDLGIKHFVTTSDGEYIDSPKPLQKYLKQLRIENRSLSRKKKYSNNWYKQVLKLKKLYLKISRIRKDFLHKISTYLSKIYGLVFIEDLEVSRMILDSRFSRSISDMSWSEFVNLLSYKINVIKVDAKYSSQECNNCGNISKDNRVKQELFKCIQCGHSGNADYEASLTILKRGQTLLHANVEQ